MRTRRPALITDQRQWRKARAAAGVPGRRKLLHDVGGMLDIWTSALKVCVMVKWKHDEEGESQGTRES
jgi:hypothetical protein